MTSHIDPNPRQADTDILRALPIEVRSERVLLHGASRFEIFEDCVALITPANPHFFWGNCLLLFERPAPGSRTFWLNRFRELIEREAPTIRHIAIGWSGEALGDSGEWVAPDWSFFSNQVMTLRELRNPPHAPPADFLGAASEADWRDILELSVATRGDAFGEAGYRIFMEAHVAHWRALIALGRGQWFIAKKDGVLVASCGVFHETRAGADGRRIGRFQQVTTHADFRRQGYCATLMHYAASWVIRRQQLDELVIVADIAGGANRVYAQVGFADRHTSHGAQWMPPRAENLPAAS